jgi:ribosomal protein L11 methyltransferase
VTPKGYIELRLKISGDAGEFIGMLVNDSVLGAWEREGEILLYFPEGGDKARWMKEIESKLRELGEDPENAILDVLSLPDREWNAIWAESARPIRLGRRLLIRQSWNPVKMGPGEIEIIIDPSRAFGTGYHATTQMVLEWLEDIVKGRERVLDIGTGSGILAMAAIRLGAASALGIDLDPVAIECAQGYAILNGFGDELELRTGSLEDHGAGRYDLILANLDRATLLHYCRRFKVFAEPGATGLLSGLQLEDAKDIGDAVAAGEGRIVDRRERDGWVALRVDF